MWSVIILPALCVPVHVLRFLPKEEKVSTAVKCVFYRQQFSIYGIKEEPKLFPLNSLFDANRDKNVPLTKLHFRGTLLKCIKKYVLVIVCPVLWQYNTGNFMIIQINTDNT